MEARIWPVYLVIDISPKKFNFLLPFIFAYQHVVFNFRHAHGIAAKTTDGLGELSQSG